jgi:hypothetical protein
MPVKCFTSREWGKIMKVTLRFLFLFVAWIGVSLSGTTASANTANLKCNSNKDRVWVYDSLTTFDIEAKLNCGETVEIVERVKDYVRIRTQNGVEGYVPETQISDLPAFKDPTPDVGSVAKQIQAREVAKAAESQSPFIAPIAAPRVSPSLAADPTTGPSGKDTNTKKATAGGEVIPATPLAEINSSPFSAPAREASSGRAEVGTPEPNTPSSKPLDGPSVTASENTDRTKISKGIPVRSAVAASDPDESSDLELKAKTPDPACRSYLSAYGLTSSQLKWISQNRKKLFPSVCPAPDLSKVNFVIIFTHDVDFYSVTMPKPVHNVNGFSDFQALTTVDTALVPASKENKAHREYVWIFQFANGGFNPETFSQRRRHQFTKVESNSLGSNAGPRVVEDAFRFVEATNR